MALAKATLGTSIGTVYTSTNDSATTSIFFTNDNVLILLSESIIMKK